VPEDRALEPFVFPGLAMPRPLLFRGEYPPVERRLKTLKRASPAKGPVPPARFRADDFDPFNPEAPKRPAAKREPKPPEHCLVRVLDVTVRPGTTYQYRLRVRMANPNQGKKETVPGGPGVMLVSPWHDLPAPVVMPPEVVYYAVDQMELEGRRSYKGPKWNARPGQVVLQAHRWVDHVRVSTLDLPVGEWVVAERFAVYRGEQVGRHVRVEVPVWDYLREKFVIAAPRGRGARAPAGVDVDFGYGYRDHTPPEAVLVDFEGGSVRHASAGRRVADAYAPQALLLNPDGKLALLEGALDARDRERRERLRAYRARVEEVKGKAPAPGDNPFGR
jgi:hypothetical protein